MTRANSTAAAPRAPTGDGGTCFLTGTPRRRQPRRSGCRGTPVSVGQQRRRVAGGIEKIESGALDHLPSTGRRARALSTGRAPTAARRPRRRRGWPARRSAMTDTATDRTTRRSARYGERVAADHLVAQGHGGARPQLAVRRGRARPGAARRARRWWCARSRPAPASTTARRTRRSPTPSSTRLRRLAVRWVEAHGVQPARDPGRPRRRAAPAPGAGPSSSTCGGSADARRVDPHASPSTERSATWSTSRPTSRRARPG